MDFKLDDWQEIVISGKELSLVVVTKRDAGKTTTALLAAKRKPDTTLVVTYNPDVFRREDIKTCSPRSLKSYLCGKRYKSKDGRLEQIIFDDPAIEESNRDLIRDILMVRQSMPNTRIVVMGSMENKWSSRLFLQLIRLQWEYIDVF